MAEVVPGQSEIEQLQHACIYSQWLAFPHNIMAVKANGPSSIRWQLQAAIVIIAESCTATCENDGSVDVKG